MERPAPSRVVIAASQFYGNKYQSCPHWFIRLHFDIINVKSEINCITQNTVCYGLPIYYSRPMRLPRNPPCTIYLLPTLALGAVGIHVSSATSLITAEECWVEVAARVAAKAIAYYKRVC